MRDRDVYSRQVRNMPTHPLVRFAIAVCPPDYRREYEQSIIADMRTRGESPYAVAADLCYQGVAMRLESLWRDLAFAARTLSKSRMYAVVAIVAIALAIACNVAVGSVLDGVLLKPLPYPNADRLVNVGFDIGYGQFSYLDSVDYRAQQTTLERFGISTDDNATFSGAGAPVTVHGSDVDGGYFAVLGARAEIGRLLATSDLGKRNVVISDRLWRKYFNRNAGAVGKTMLLDMHPYRIVGVMPSGFRDISPKGMSALEFWLPIDPRGSVAKQRGYTQYDAWGILRPGVSVSAARADAERLITGIVHRYPAFHDVWNGAVVTRAMDLLVGPVRQMIWLMYAAAIILLIIACANVINLTLVRAAARERELLMRTALGASRGRIAAQLTVEMGLLSVVAGIIGVALRWAALRLFDGVGSSLIPRWEDVHVDLAVLVYVCVLLALTSILTGIAPALARRRDLLSGLKAAGRSGDSSGAKRLRVGIVIAEIALTLGVITSAGLMLRSFLALTHVDLGFNAKHLYAISLPSLPKAQYPNYDAQLQVVDRAEASVRAIPGVTDAAATTVIPFKGGFVVGTTIPGMHGTFESNGNSVAPGYFGVMGIPLMRGRDFMPSDGPHSQSVTIVNETFARKYFGTLDVVGKRIKPGISSGNTPSEIRTIVGVVADTRNHFADRMEPEFYLPITQLQTLSLIVARTNGANFPVADAVKKAFARVAPSLAAPEVISYDSLFRQDAGRWQASALLFGVLAAVALLLALAGIYAVTAYSVTQRTQEFGIRKAIGAKDASVLGVVISDAFRQAAIGVAIGLLLAAACTRLLEPLLFQTSPFDPLTYAGVVLLIVTCALCAALIPALRATRVQPATALRYE